MRGVQSRAARATRAASTAQAAPTAPATAASLATTATTHARAGDCATALAIAERVRQLDAEYYGRTLALEPSILTSAPVPSAPAT